MSSFIPTGHLSLSAAIYHVAFKIHGPNLEPPLTVEEDSKLQAYIRLRSYEAGEHKTVCPRCSAQRKKSNEPCLNVKMDIITRR